jgi:hypothetical protein
VTDLISENAVQSSLARLFAALELPRDNRPEREQIAEHERLAKAISFHLKALSDIRQHNLEITELTQDVRHTAYEDYPPPSPEDRARFMARLQKLYSEVAAEDELPDFIGTCPDCGFSASPA